MPLPVNVSVCTITGKFVNADGTPTEGTVVFVPTPLVILDVAAIPPTTIMGTPISVELDVNGAIPVGTTIPATDDPDLSPVDWTYKVIFSSAYYKPENFFMNAPGGTTVDLTGVLPIPESPGVPGNIPDGSRGDINVSGNGLIWDIAANVITSAEIANDAVGNTELANNAVGTAEIQDLAVTFAKMVAAAPRGRIASVADTTTQAGITAVTDLTNMTVTFTAENGRRYRVFGQSSVQQLTNASAVQLQLTDQLNAILDVRLLSLAVSYHGVLEIFYEFVGDGNSKTFKLRGVSSAASATFRPAGSSANRLLVEDIGI